jgi:hypothetical protein
MAHSLLRLFLLSSPNIPQRESVWHWRTRWFCLCVTGVAWMREDRFGDVRWMIGAVGYHRSDSGPGQDAVPPAGFEPAVSTLKGWCPRPLDEGGASRNPVRLQVAEFPCQIPSST